MGGLLNQQDNEAKSRVICGSDYFAPSGTMKELLILGGAPNAKRLFKRSELTHYLCAAMNICQQTEAGQKFIIALEKELKDRGLLKPKE